MNEDNRSRLEQAIEGASDETLTALAKELAAHPRFRKILARKLRIGLKMDAPRYRN